ncbi:hypothetical protein HY029_04270 [Candidatus Gottesmanbacteria bacterium]|nr:hypothetical protein [Candidatus Gottesmanbacteria bacterium]
MKKQQLIFVSIFTILGLIALQIPFTRLLGSNVKFTLFDFFAPTAGAFLGTLPGVISVFLMQGINYLVHGSKFDIGGIIRLFPTLFAVAYFAKKRTFNVIVPILAIIAFNINPIGRSAWQFSMFWLIPVAAHFFHKNIFARSLGATFTAHAVGGALWVWAFGLSKTIWLTLIPQVIIERTLMAAGISISYVVLTSMLKVLSKQKIFVPFITLKKHLPN